MNDKNHIQRVFDYLSHLSSDIQEELAKIHRLIESSQQEMDDLYQALEQSGDELEMTIQAYKKSLANKECLIRSYQDQGKKYIQAKAIFDAIRSQDEAQLRSALSFIYTDRDRAKDNLARAALGADQEIKQNIFRYYDVLYQRALAIDERDVQAAYDHWMDVKNDLLILSYETLPDLKKRIQEKAILHKEIMKKYETLSTENARSHMLKNEILKNSQQLEHLQLAFH